MIKKLLNKLIGNESTTPSVVSFRDGLKLTGLPIVCLNQGNKTFNFILDTGSDISVLAEHVLSEIEHEKVKVKGTLYGIDGNKIPVKVVSIALSYEDVSFTSNFLVRNLQEAFNHLKKDHGVTVHGMLGSRFFNEYKYIIDFNKLIAYSVS